MVSPIERLKEFPNVVDFYTERWFKDQLSRPRSSRHPLVNFLDNKWPSELIDLNNKGSPIREAAIRMYIDPAEEHRGYFTSLEKILERLYIEIVQSDQIQKNLRLRNQFIGEFFKLLTAFQLDNYGCVELEPTIIRVRNGKKLTPDIGVIFDDRTIFCEVCVPRLREETAGGFGKNQAIPKMNQKLVNQLSKYTDSVLNPVILFISTSTSRIDDLQVKDAISQNSKSIGGRKHLMFSHTRIESMTGVVSFKPRANLTRGMYIVGTFHAISKENSRMLNKKELDLLGKALV